MAIAIPALVDSQLNTLMAELKPVYHSDTHTFTSSVPPYAKINRAADILRLLTGLVDVTAWLTATGGTAKSVQDAGAFTGVNSLLGCKVTFQGNVTGALTDVVAYVVSNTVNELFFGGGALPATPQVGDNYKIEFTAVDSDLVVLEGGKGPGDSQSNPYGSGPNLINALSKLIVQLGGALPPCLVRVTDVVTKATVYDPAEAFHIGSPHGGAGSQGQGGAILIADALKLVRDTVAAYTKPA
jgi:hypothetical protein